MPTSEYQLLVEFSSHDVKLVKGCIVMVEAKETIKENEGKRRGTEALYITGVISLLVFNLTVFLTEQQQMYFATVNRFVRNSQTS